MSKLKCRISREMKVGETYRLATYPRHKKGITYHRDYYIYDDQGSLMAAGASQWIIINFETRKIERSDIDFEGEYYPKDAFPEGFEKIRAKHLQEVGYHLVTEADLDENDHTNNCRYADMICEAIGSSEHTELVINFAKESRLGDKLTLYRDSGEREQEIIIAAKNQSGKTVFQALVR